MTDRDEKTRQVFADSIKSLRGDEALATRYIFADWLDEQGCDDEAAAQRAWTREKQKALDWMADFAKESGRHCVDDGRDSPAYRELRDLNYGPGHRLPGHEARVEELYKRIEAAEVWVDITVEMLLEAARNWVETCNDVPDSWGDMGGDWFVQNGETGLRRRMGEPGAKERFWECYQLLTGEEVPEEKQGHVFSCSC